MRFSSIDFKVPSGAQLGTSFAAFLPGRSRAPWWSRCRWAPSRANSCRCRRQMGTWAAWAAWGRLGAGYCNKEVIACDNLEDTVVGNFCWSCISINAADVWDWLSFVDISRPCPIGEDRFVSLIQSKRSSVRPGDGKDFPSETGSAPSILHNKVRGKNPEELWWRVKNIKNHEDHEEPSISKSHKVTPFEATSHCVCAWLDLAGPTWPGSRSHFSGRPGVTGGYYAVILRILRAGRVLQHLPGKRWFRKQQRRQRQQQQQPPPSLCLPTQHA